MDAMEYESLVRMAYDCGRGGVKGADTYYYNQMETLERNLETKTLYATEEERQNKFQEAFNTVKYYVKDAITKGIERLKYRLKDSDKAMLDSFVEQMNYKMNDRELLDRIIDKASNIFIKNGLSI